MKITTIEEHQAGIAKDVARNIERLDMDVEDCALSSWSADNNIRANKCAIRALELGHSIGLNAPAVEVLKLVDLMTGDTVDAKEINGKYGIVWILDDSAASHYGRRFIPVGKNSRVQRELGLGEQKVVVRARRWIQTVCMGIGMPISYYVLADDDV